MPVARVTQGGILLPDRDYYLSADPTIAGVRSNYRQYLAHLFELTGRATAADDALAVLQLETSLARALWTEAATRDVNATNTRFTLRQLSAEMPGFDWAAWAKPQGLDRSGKAQRTSQKNKTTKPRRLCDLCVLSDLGACAEGAVTSVRSPLCAVITATARLSHKTPTCRRPSSRRWR